MSWINSNIVMIGTKVEPNLEGNQLWLNKYNKLKLSKPNSICPGPQLFQHIYFVSDEIVKVGDWVIFDTNSDCFDYEPSVGKYEMNIFDINKKKEFKYTKKIIAASDKVLGLPEPSKEFLGLYCEKYNKGIAITKVEVEYNTNNIHKQKLMFHPDHKEYFFEDVIHRQFKTIYLDEKLKVNPDKTINIKPIKESWNKEEVKSLLLKLNSEKPKYPEAKRFNFDIYKWIEENL